MAGFWAFCHYPLAMDATAVIAALGLLATTITAIGVPFIQGQIAARRELAAKLYDERLAAYVEAMVFVRAVQSRLDETVEDPVFRQSYTWPEMPHRDLIAARLQLVAPPELFKSWSKLTSAWDALSWNIQQDGPVNEYGDYYREADATDVIRVRSASEALIVELRRVADVKAAG